MATPLPAASVPAWTVGDRLRKAREHAQLSQAELGGQLGISRASIVHYEKDEFGKGRFAPSRPVIAAWAVRTGVPLAWLCHGDTRPCDWRPARRPVDVTTSQSKSNYMQSNVTVNNLLKAA